MDYMALIFGVIVVVLIFWVIHLKIQIRSISRQLEKRLDNGSKNSIYSALGDKDIIRLAMNLNKCFTEDENTKTILAQEEKKFRSLIANISHDLRTPLTSIKGYLQLLSATELDNEQRRKLNIILKHTDELGNLIEHFFEYSCLIGDETQLNSERFNLTNEVTECLAAAVPQFESRNLEVRLAENSPVFIISDKEKIIRILQNLIRNCIQHSAGNISASVTQSGGFALISISNPVRETDEIDINKIFERFYTAEKHRSKSTGLGMSIVKLLAEQMNGSVSAELNGNMLTVSVSIPSEPVSKNTPMQT